jgi:hypothetical protein
VSCSGAGDGVAADSGIGMTIRECGSDRRKHGNDRDN